MRYRYQIETTKGEVLREEVSTIQEALHLAQTIADSRREHLDVVSSPDGQRWPVYPAPSNRAVRALNNQ